MHQHTRRVFIILFMTGIISTTYWLGPIESTSSDQKSQSAQSKTQAKSPPPVGAKSLPENQVPGRTSRRRSSVGGTVSSGVAGKPSTQAADTSNVPTPAIPVGQSGEMIGVPWTGAAGIIETTEQMMIRERQAQLLPRKPRPLRKELEYERPKDLPQNPDAPAVSQWPPVDESNSSQRPGQPGLTVSAIGAANHEHIIYRCHVGRYRRLSARYHGGGGADSVLCGRQWSVSDLQQNDGGCRR